MRAASALFAKALRFLFLKAQADGARASRTLPLQLL
jgi:hypothetical protein